MADFRKYLGGGGDYYLRDPRHAHRLYGFANNTLVENLPRLKFQYFARINFNRSDPEVYEFIKRYLDIDDQFELTALVKTFTPPKIDIDTEKLDQYNKWRISQTKVRHNPVEIVFHDTVDGKTLRFWEMYYEFYFQEGITRHKLSEENEGRSRNESEYINDIIPTTSADDINRQFINRWGYNLPQVQNSKYLIDSIDLFQVHRNRATRTEIIHPRITSFEQDTHDYSDDTGTAELRFTFEYENVVYQNNYDVLTDVELWNYRRSDHLELPGLIDPPAPVRQRDLFDKTPLPGRDLLSTFQEAGNLISGNASAGDVARRLLQNSGSVSYAQGELNEVLGAGISEASSSVSSWSIFDSQIGQSGLSGVQRSSTLRPGQTGGGTDFSVGGGG